MPDEHELRRMLQGAEAPNTLDAKRIVSRSRARRIPKQIAAGATSALVLVGVTVLGVQATQYSSPVSMTAGEAFDESAPAPELYSDQDATESLIKRAPADKVNLCTAPLAEIAPSQYGLQLDVVAPMSAVAASGSVPVTVQLTNTSRERVVGYTPSSPAITLSQGGTVLWHSNGPTDLSLVMVDLAPGASQQYTASFEPVRCGVEDDSAESFPADLPVVPPGEYELSALIDFTADPVMQQQTTELDLVGGPVAPITLG